VLYQSVIALLVSVVSFDTHGRHYIPSNPHIVYNIKLKNRNFNGWNENKMNTQSLLIVQKNIFFMHPNRFFLLTAHLETALHGLPSYGPPGDCSTWPSILLPPKNALCTLLHVPWDNAGKKPMMAASPAAGIQIWEMMEKILGSCFISLATTLHDTWGKLEVGGQSTEENLLCSLCTRVIMSYYRKRVSSILSFGCARG